jgi:drug/metabolite transporter (DMT)-like permease
MLIFLTALTGSIVPTLAKYALEVFDTFILVAIRFSTASLVLLPLVLKTKEINWKNFKNTLLTSFLGALNPILLFIALNFTKASFASLIYACVPALTATYLIVFGNKKLNKSVIVGVIIGLLGVLLIILGPMLSGSDNILAEELNGNFLIFLAAVAFMFFSIRSKNQQIRDKHSPTAISFYLALTTFIISLPFLLWELTSTQSSFSQVNVFHILAALGTGIIGTGLFYLLIQITLKTGSAIAGTLFTYLQPIIGVFLAFILLGENITVYMIVGGVLSIAGAQMASKRLTITLTTKK